jgi:hypothetical protein
MNFGSTGAKVWKDIWGAGQGVGTVDDVRPSGTSWLASPVSTTKPAAPSPESKRAPGAHEIEWRGATLRARMRD